MERWNNRVALVTGASYGIGEALAKKLAENGMKVVGCGRSIDKIKELSESVSKSRGKIYPFQCDVSKEDQILEMFAYIKREFGRVDICVNNAGLSHLTSLLSGNSEEWRNILDVNVLGLCICTREAVKLMRENNIDDGHIIHVNSLSGHRVLPAKDNHFYAASKYAVTALTEGLRQELREIGSHIRITSISPGLVETHFHAALYSDNQDAAKKIYSNLKCLEAGDIADSIIYAISAPPHVQVHDILIRPTEQTF